ncbi:hypothetical protein EPI10_002144 [Gossypium australe]|uniref:Uncharacterized protein n=1 Tax=Gossypium australe TaxID=47621 RepID=A0A5B6VDD0_9ROSI|nr:hypothetical protein EPI10_002144 [Gossypium australe]
MNLLRFWIETLRSLGGIMALRKPLRNLKIRFFSNIRICLSQVSNVTFPSRLFRVVATDSLVNVGSIGGFMSKLQDFSVLFLRVRIENPSFYEFQTLKNMVVDSTRPYDRPYSRPCNPLSIK